MTDVIDVAQRRQQEEIDHALESARLRAGKTGRTTCANLACGEPIAPLRTAMGATFCLDCQQRAEREAQQCARAAH